MNLLTYDEVLELHQDSIDKHGGSPGIIAGKEGAVRFAIEQPIMGFGDQDLYPTIEEKTAAVGFSLAMGHCFNDGNKRIAFSAMYVFLQKNGYLLDVEPKEAVSFMLALAAGEKDREDLVDWINTHLSSSAVNLQVGLEEEDERLSFGEVSPLSVKALQIEADRPTFWKAKVFAQVLEDEVARYSKEREEHRAGYSSGPKRGFEQFEFFDWLRQEMNKRLKIATNQKRIINFLSDMSFAESVEQGDLDSMIAFARELGGFYREAIEWSQQFRQLNITPDFEGILEALATFFERFISQVEQLPATFREEIATAEELGADEKHTIKIILDYGPDNDELGEELDTLAARLGLEDEQGFGANDYVGKALSSSAGYVLEYASLTGTCAKNIMRWNGQIDKLANRPIHIANVQRTSLLASIAQLIIRTSGQINRSLPTLRSCVETLERYGPLLANLFNPKGPTFEEDIEKGVENIRKAQSLVREVQEMKEDILSIIAVTENLSPKTKSASENLTRDIESYTALIARILSSCDLQIQSLEAKLADNKGAAN